MPKPFYKAKEDGLKKPIFYGKMVYDQLLVIL
jgi:hypothetical protein